MPDPAAPRRPLVLATAKEGIELVVGVQFSADGSALLVHGSLDATYPVQKPVLTVWGLPAGRILRRVEAKYGSLSTDGRLLAGLDEETVRVWDIPTGRVRHRFETLAAPTFSPDGRYLVTETQGAEAIPDGIQVWDVMTGKRVFRAPRVKEHEIYSHGFLSGNRFAFETLRFQGKGEGRLYVADLATGGQRLAVKYWADIGAFGNAGPRDTFAVIDPDGRPRLYDIITGTLIRRFGPDGSAKNWIRNVDISRDGRSLVGPIRPGVLAVWDIMTGDERATFEVSGAVKDFPLVRFTPDGRYVVIRWQSGGSNMFQAWHRDHAAVYAVDGRLVWQGRGVAAVEFDRPMKSVAIVSNARGDYTQYDPPNVVEVHDAATWLARGAKKE
jgi:WD40 repeat protein